MAKRNIGLSVSAAEVEFAAELTRYRLGANLSQRELADKIAFARPYICRAERPGGLVSTAAVEAIDFTLSADGRLVDLHRRATQARKARRHEVRQNSSVRRPVQHSGSGPTVKVGSQSNPLALSSIDAQLMAIDDLIADVTGSETTNHAIGHLDSATKYLAEHHSQASPHAVLSEIVRVHDQLCSFKSKRKRLSQERELYRIESDLLSQACLIYGDLRRHSTAVKLGEAALVLAVESGASQAIARTALAKTLRWTGRLVESAVMARTGYEHSPRTPVRVQLASQEANAAALLGDSDRAYEALGRAEQAAATCAADSGRSAWSFSIGRQAVFRLSVATSSGNPRLGLDAVAMADDAWASGAPCVVANWAQIRAGAGVAHLLRGSFDDAEREITPMLSIPPDRRVSTVTAYTADVARRIEISKLRNHAPAVKLREAILEFSAGSTC